MGIQPDAERIRPQNHMVVTKPELKTFADYVAYDDDTDTRYELVKG